MRQKLLLKSFFLLFCMIAGVGSAWADEVTFDYADYNKQGTQSSGSEYTMVKSAVSITNNKFYGNNSYAHFYANGTTTITPAEGVTITQIKLTASSTNYNGYQSSGTVTASTGEMSHDDIVLTWSGNSTSAFTITNNKQIRWTTIVVTYTTSGDDKNTSDLVLTGSTELSFDLYNNATDQVISYTTSSTGAVTIADNAYATFSINETAKTITVTPTAKTTGAETITVKQAADENYNAGSATFTLTITDSTPKTGAWVLTDLANLSEGDVFVIVGDNGNTYAMSNNNGTSSAPSAVAVSIENDEITSDVADDIKWNISGDADNGYTFYPNGDTNNWLYCTNSNNGVRVGVGDAKHFTLSSGGYLTTTETQYQRYLGIYNSQDWRCYKKETESNIKDQSFAFYKYEGTAVAVKNPVITVDETFVGSTIATITCATDDATIYYSYDNTNWTEYTTALTITETTTIYAKAVKDEDESAVVSKTTTKVLPTPTISPAEGSFNEAQNVTISCDTEGAEIYYTVVARDNGGNIYGAFSTQEYTLYNNPITIGNQDYVLSYTISAYAVKDGKQSNVANATITIDLRKQIVVTPSNIDLGKEGGTGTLEVSFINYPEYRKDNAGFHYWKETETGSLLLDGNVPEWFHISYSEDYSTLTYTVDPNTTTEARAIEVNFWVQNTFSDRIYFTQAAYVADYATLPFKFDGGRTAIEETAGLTQEDLGSDYSSSPKLRFDNTGDWVILEFNERPGTLTFDIKGNSFSDGTFTVQTSADGETYTDLETYTELGNTQSEEFSNLDEDVRYIKWIYTEKVSGNVALGNITLAKYSAVAAITVDPAEVNVDAAEQEGTLDLTYANLTITEMDDFGIQYYDAEGEEVSEPDWIEVLVAGQDPQVGEGYVVSYNMLENEGEERTAYFKVYAMGGEEFIYSNLVTVTQAAYVAPSAPGTWVLTNIEDLTENDVFVIVGTDEVDNTYALPNNGTGAPSAQAITVVEGTLSGDIAGNLQWNISGNASDGYTFYPNGDTENWLYCNTTAASSNNNNMRVGTGDRKVFVMDGAGYLVTKDDNVDRYLSIYDSQDWRGYVNTNSAVVISFYKKQSPVTGTATITLNAACTDGEFVYGTYSNTSAFVVPSNLTVSEITVIDGELLVEAYSTGAVVPANTGVMVAALEGGDHSVDLTSDAGASVLGDDNMLKPTGDNGITAEQMAENAPNCTYYRLTMHNGTEIGFWWGANNGAAFSVAANKAYLAVPKKEGVRQGFAFGEDATGIATVKAGANVDGYYNLQGQRVEKPAHGLYIVNGKKIVVK